MYKQMNRSMPSAQEREAALFALAVEKPAAERAAFLQAVCGNDQSLRARLEALLAAHEQPDEALNEAAAAAGDTTKIELDNPADEAVGQTLGRYKLLERVGEGGCGVVYVAEQTEPVRRRVALKVIKLGMDTKQVVARFEAERQALAMMDHPNIAKVLDAGTTAVAESQISNRKSQIPGGRPYFVMELVRGIKITDYCDQNNLPTQERLDLFIKVCQAIQHAHQKGIIHRDIKPSNILVTLHDGVPVPKVIDFGIAKATEGRLTDNTVYTQLHQFIGTPAYMSPEQAEMSGLDIDTRSDIYSLGVLLYELLAGSTPFDPKELMASGIDAMRKTIREKEPVRPSTRLTQELVAASRQSAADSGGENGGALPRRRYGQIQELIHLLKGDLDWIVMKCLEKDRSRRYETANGLAADLKRHLNNEPVVARPPSTVYRLQKAFRRNKLLFASGATVAVALVVGLSVSVFAFLREQAARADAITAQHSAEAQKADADKARGRAEEIARRLRLQNYVADIRSIQQALAANNRGEAITRLRKYFPAPGTEDIRGFEWSYLWRQAMGDDLIALGGHDGPVSGARFSPDGAFLASIGLDGKLLIRRAGSWDIVARIPASDLRAWHNPLAFSPDGRHLAAQGPGGLIFVETAHWTVSHRLPGAFAPMDFSPDGRWLASWSEEGPKIWNVADWTFRLLEAAPAARFAYCTMRFAPNSRHLAFSGGPIGVTVWDLTAGQRIQKTDVGPQANEFTRDSQRLFVGNFDGDDLLAVFDVQTGAVVHRPAGGAELGIFSLALSPDGALFASAGANQVIHLWDAQNFEPRGSLRGHEDEVWSVAFSPDGRQLVSAGKDGTVRIWPVSPPPAAPTIQIGRQNYWTTRFSADGERVTAFHQDRLHAWRAVDGQHLGSLALNHATATNGLRVRPSILQSDIGTVLHPDGSATIVQLDTGSPRGTLPKEMVSSAVHISPESDFCLVSHYASDSLRIWDFNAKKVRAEWPLPFESAAGILSPNGQWLARVTTNYQIALHDPQTGEFVRSLAGPKWNVGSLAVSPDSGLLAVGSWDARIYIWNVQSGELVCPPLRGHRRGVQNLQFSLDQRTLISASDDFTVRLWNVQAGQELLVLEKTEHAIVSPDNLHFARRDLDGILHLHRLPTHAKAEARNRGMVQFLNLDRPQTTP
jgi:serine/threonine protein kinase/WD40 repeat protein